MVIFILKSTLHNCIRLLLLKGHVKYSNILIIFIMGHEVESSEPDFNMSRATNEQNFGNNVKVSMYVLIPKGDN